MGEPGKIVCVMVADYGRVAAARGVRQEVRAHGAKMVAEQALLLQELRALAIAEGVMLADRISIAKAYGLCSLEQQTGDDTDSMFTIDHERWVKEFKKAQVRAYAQRRLPMIESHLAEIRAIDEAE